MVGHVATATGAARGTAIGAGIPAAPVEWIERAGPTGPDGWAGEVVGAASVTRLAGGAERRFVNLDNAATTPALVAVQQAVTDFLPWYSSVHRGAGVKSRLSTAAFEDARRVVGLFLGVDDARQDVVFVKSATEGLNKVARGLAGAGATVFTTAMEHHANLLPWRLHASSVRYIRTDDAGVIDEESLARQLDAAPRGPKLLAVAGAYNVTGYTPPIHRLAALAHARGAEILVDGAQLVPHRAVDVRGGAPGEEIDYLVFSAHKAYAPFGTGVLVAPRRFFGGTPDLVGGGAAASVTADDIVWARMPHREEAGSPNVIGAVALAAALRRLDELGRARVEAREAALTAYAAQRLAAVPGLTLLGPREGRVVILPFVLDGVPSDLAAAILGYEHGIGVRAGLFCAHQGVRRLLAAVPSSPSSPSSVARDGRDTSGAVRASVGLYNTWGEIDALAEALWWIAADRHAARRYARDAAGDYRPLGWTGEDDAALPWLRPVR